MNFREYFDKHILLLDGGMGSLLQKLGLPSGSRPEEWNISNPEAVISVHKQYYDSGSNVVCTNTFGVNSLYYPDDKLELLISSAVDIAKRAREQSSSDNEKFIAYDLGPTGKLLKPMGDIEFEEAVRIFGIQARLAEKYGVDLITIETMTDSYETKAALLAVKENCSLPVFVTNAYGEDGNLLSGASCEAMVAMLEGLGADAIGLNCSFGPDKQLDTIKRIVDCASVPVIYKPNAGMPVVTDGATSYDIDAETFAGYIADAVDYGVNIIGGCCGTTPEYISALSSLIEGKQYKPVCEKNKTVASCGTGYVEFGFKPVIIGERLNPTGKKLIKKALAEHDIDYLIFEGKNQIDAGAHILDVNCGLPEINEKELLKEAVCGIQSVCNVPLQIDTSDPEAMESALRVYNGKAVINSVNGKQEVMDSVFPIAKKYGGVVIALTLDENGIPDSAEGRLEIAFNILKNAESYGISRKNIVFDPLTLTVSTDSDAGITTLKSIKLIKQKTGCNTVLGVSNVSFGLPAREKLNSSFLSLAVFNGLSGAIMNPMSKDMMDSYYSSAALLGIDKSCLDYISFISNNPSNEQSSISDEKLSENDIERGIVDGRKELAVKAVKEFVNEGNSLEIINDYIIPALDVVGKKFEEKTIYLPQLLMSADAAKACFDIIKTFQKANNEEKKYTVILATVKGDIHDIGKNIVKLLLENYGYDVIDLGKDVPPEKILESADKNNAVLVGLSALMTTTVGAMEDTIKLIHSNLPGCKVMVGGAVLTEEYAEQIGADAYAADAMESVRYAESLL